MSQIHSCGEEKKRHLLTQLYIGRLMQSTELSLYQPEKVQL